MPKNLWTTVLVDQDRSHHSSALSLGAWIGSKPRMRRVRDNESVPFHRARSAFVRLKLYTHHRVDGLPTPGFGPPVPALPPRPRPCRDSRSGPAGAAHPLHHRQRRVRYLHPEPRQRASTRSASTRSWRHPASSPRRRSALRRWRSADFRLACQGPASSATTRPGGDERSR